MFSIFKGNNTHCSSETKCAAPHPRLTIVKVFRIKTVGQVIRKRKKFTGGRTDRQTDGRTDAEGHNIKRPFFKWAYKNLVEEICHTFVLSYGFPQMTRTIFKTHFCVQLGSYAILGYFGNIW